LVGWVGSIMGQNISKNSKTYYILKLSSLCPIVVGCMEFDWVSWVGLWVQSFYFAMGWVGLKKLDPRTTLLYASCILR